MFTLVLSGQTPQQLTLIKESLGLERHNQRTDDLEPLNGAPGHGDLSSLVQARREGQSHPAVAGRQDQRLEGDREARRLIGIIRSTRPSPCPKKMAAKAKEILARIQEVI